MDVLDFFFIKTTYLETGFSYFHNSTFTLRNMLNVSFSSELFYLYSRNRTNKPSGREKNVSKEQVGNLMILHH